MRVIYREGEALFLAEADERKSAQIVETAAFGVEIVHRQRGKGAIQHLLCLGVFVAVNIDLAEQFQRGRKIRLQFDGA